MPFECDDGYAFVIVVIEIIIDGASIIELESADVIAMRQEPKRLSFGHVECEFFRRLFEVQFLGRQPGNLLGRTFERLPPALKLERQVRILFHVFTTFR